MQEFFNNLYNIENFTLYLAIAIGVLVVVFFIILFIGKKDQKLEQTKKLQKLAKEGFKEESAPVKVETKKAETVDILLQPSTIKAPEENKVVPSSEVVPEIEVYDPTKDASLIESTKVAEPEVFEDVKPAEVKEFDLSGSIKTNEMDVKPLLDEKLDDTLIFSPSALTEEIKLPEVKEEPKVNLDFSKEVEVSYSDDIKLPTFDFEETLKPNVEEVKIAERVKEDIKTESFEPVKFTSSPVFSSVYAPAKEEVKVEVPSEVEISNEPIKINEVEPIRIGDDLIDLPKLKTEEDKTVNIPNNSSEGFSLDSILGETYNINK